MRYSPPRHDTRTVWRHAAVRYDRRDTAVDTRAASVALTTAALRYENGRLTKPHVQSEATLARGITHAALVDRRGPKSPTAGSLGVVDAREGRTARAALVRVKSHILPQAQEPEPEHAPTRRRRRAAHATYKRSAPSISPPRAASTRRRHAAEEARSVDRRSR